MSGPAMRERLVAAANELFYADGIRHVPIDQVLARAGVTRSSLYRYFQTKEDLVLAYLAQRDAAIREQFAQGAKAADSPDALLGLIGAAIGHEICGDGFRGCPFINAAAEYPEPDHPVQLAVRAHRAWFLEAVHGVLVSAEVPEADTAARVLVMLRDGAMVGGYLDDAQADAAALTWAVKALTGKG